MLRLLVVLLASATAALASVKTAAPSDEILGARGQYRSCFVSPKSDEAGVYIFRKTFELKSAPKEFAINIAADNRYELYVNGKYVCRGSAAGGILNWYFDTVDIAPFLRAGKNAVCARVAYMGDFRPNAWETAGAALWIQSNAQEHSFIDTIDPGWKIVKDESVSFSKGVMYAVAAENYDASKLARGWKDADFDDSKWEGARPNGRPSNPRHYGEIHKRLLVPRDIPMLEETPVRLKSVRKISGLAADPAKVGFIRGEEFEIPAKTSCEILLDAGCLTNAFTRLSLRGGRGAKISALYCESLAKPGADGKISIAGKGDRGEIEGKKPVSPLADTYLADGSEASFESFDFRTFRYVLLKINTAEEPLVLRDFSGVFTGYPLAEKAKFESPDPSHAKIWEVGWRTQRLCANDRFFDCPFYERLMYVGDTRIQALTALYVSGDSALMRRAINLFNLSRRSDGLTFARAPSRIPQFIPPFSLYWIGMLRDYYMHVGDAEFVRQNLGGVEAVLNWYLGKIDPKTGMLAPDLPYWNFVDWVVDWKMGVPPESAQSGSAIVSLHLAIALRDASFLMRSCGKSRNTLYYNRIANNICRNVYKRCWNPERGLLRDAEGVEKYSQHANIFGILSGAIPPGERAGVLERIAREAKSSYAPHAPDDVMEATFYFKFYLFRAMKMLGKGDMFLDSLDPWREMIDVGLTTFAENPEPTRSDCHAWSASPLYEFFATVCGITPASPGFGGVKVAPALGKLGCARAKMPHPKGEISVDFKRVGRDGISAKIILPKGVLGEFVWNGKSYGLSGGENSFEIPETSTVRVRKGFHSFSAKKQVLN